jgi:two-component system, cell cycle response regulator DivK
VFASRGRKPIVMVVDDSDDMRELMALQLQLNGYEVIEAKDGLQAVELACQSNPALILMDINMPVMDGMTATRAIRDNKELGQIAIVAFSAFKSKENQQRALEAGCNGFVDKAEGISHLPGIVQQYVPAPAH